MKKNTSQSHTQKEKYICACLLWKKEEKKNAETEKNEKKEQKRKEEKLN